MKLRIAPAKNKALVLGLAGILCWAVSPVMIRAVRDFFSVSFFNFIRFLLSSLLLWVFFILTSGITKLKSVSESIPGFYYKILVISVVLFISQSLYTYGLFLIYPGLATLIQESDIIFAAAIAYLLFQDERKTLSNWRFLVGAIVAITGVILVIAGGEDLGRLEFNLGFLAIVLSTLTWSLHSALFKKWLARVPATLSVSLEFTCVGLFFLITHIFSNKGFRIPEAPISKWIIMIISGFTGLGMGFTFYYRALPVIGLALASSLGLLIPLLTGIISYFVFGELLSVWQILGGVVLLSGCYLAIRIRFGQIK